MKRATVNRNYSMATLAAVVCGILLFFPITSCHKSTTRKAMRSVYYWSTTLDIDSAKTAFIHRHRITRMYTRYFDVVTDGNGRAMPNATLQFNTKMPYGVDIVPTVFVMPECLHNDRKQLAGLIVRRVLQMNATNDVTDVKEIQIDCDWTASTRRLYDEFMQSMLAECHNHKLKLSSTIRLHQLAQMPPPADRGILMMYNTGNAADIHCNKPILDTKDAAPYLPFIAKYGLPLSTAYPVFSWRILFRGGRFVGFVHHDGEYPILTGDSIVTRQPSLDDIIVAIHAVDKRRADANNEIILFDLSKKNINLLKSDEYETIFNL